MKATGIVRRIDDLGRVVIPKEIRRTLRIREGDPLEIFTEKDGEVIFKKYSPVGELSNFVNMYAEIINKSTGITSLITDKDSIIASAGVYKRSLFEKKLSREAEIIVSQRTPYVYRLGEKRIPVCSDEEKFNIGICAKIIVDGDIAGSIILLIDDTGALPSETDVKLICTTAQLLAGQLES